MTRFFWVLALCVIVVTMTQAAAWSKPHPLDRASSSDIDGPRRDAVSDYARWKAEREEAFRKVGATLKTYVTTVVTVVKAVIVAVRTLVVSILKSMMELLLALVWMVVRFFLNLLLH